MDEKTTTKFNRSKKVQFTEAIPSNSEYDPKYCQALYAHLAKGLSMASFDVGVTHITILNWIKKYGAFALARERGEKKRLQLLEAAGIKMIVDGNAVAWKFMMQEFGMQEKVKITVGASDDAEETEIINITPERKKRIERIRELGRQLKIK